jgi:hypothetical protein
MLDNADPLDGWHRSDYLPHAPKAKHDTYGSLFFLLRHLLHKFCKRIHSGHVSFQMFAVDARQLPQRVGPDIKFDRIEVCEVLF